MFVWIAAVTTVSLSVAPSSTVGTDSLAVVAPMAKLTVFAPSSADATMSSDSETNTLTFSGLSVDSTGFDAVRVNDAAVPSVTLPSPAMITVAGPTVKKPPWVMAVLFPAAFTIRKYSSLLFASASVSRMTDVLVLPVEVHMAPLSVVYSYPVMGEPPSLAGAVHSIFTAWWPSVAVRPVGGPGGPAGVVTVATLDAGPVPMALIAETL